MGKPVHSLARYTTSSLRALLQALPDLVWLKDAEGVYLACNHRFEAFFGALEQDILGRTDYDFVSKELADSFRENDRKAMACGAPSVNEEWLTFMQDGHRELVETTKTPLLNARGRLIGVLGIAHDITARKRLEQYEKFRSNALELLASHTALPAVLETIVRGVEQLHPGMLCSILLLDAAGQHLVEGVAPSLPAFYNAAINGIEIGMGVGSCGTAAFTGQRVVVEDIASHPYWAPYVTLAAQAGLGSCWSQPIVSAASEVLGTFAIYHATRFAPSASDIYIIEQSARLASIAIERKRMEMQVQFVAFHDALTGLPNRMLLHDRLEQARAACKRYGRYAAVLFIDLDNFKPLNDEQGHDVGDLLLQEVAQRLSLCVREVDTVARFGGDEFVVILSELDVDRARAMELAQAVAEKICCALSLPYVLHLNDGQGDGGTVEHHCSASIGAVLFNHTVGTEADLVKWADRAMYQAKAAGRGRVQFMDCKGR